MFVLRKKKQTSLLRRGSLHAWEKTRGGLVEGKSKAREELWEGEEEETD